MRHYFTSSTVRTKEEEMSDGLPWMDYIDQSLLRALQRAQLFVRTFSTMLRREFYHAPAAYRAWQEYKLPLLLHVVEHIQTLSFASENVSPECMVQSDGRWVVLDPKLFTKESSRWKGLHHPYSTRLNALCNRIECLLSSKDVSDGTHGNLQTIERLRDARLRANDLYFLLESWANCFASMITVNAESIPVKLFYSERRRRVLSDTLAVAQRVISGPVDVLSFCLHTRTAALTCLCELTLGGNWSDCAQSEEEVFDSLIHLHDDALLACSKVPEAEKDKLWEHALDSIRWRKETLFAPNSELRRSYANLREPRATRCIELYFLPSSEWMHRREMIPVQIESEQADAIRSRWKPWDFILEPVRKIDEKSWVRISIQHEANEDVKAELRLLGNRFCLDVTVPRAESVDHHLLASVELLFLQLQQSPHKERLQSKPLQEKLHKARSLAITEYRNSELRVRSKDRLERHDYNSMYSTEKEAVEFANLADEQTLRGTLGERVERVLDFIERDRYRQCESHGFTVSSITSSVRSLREKLWQKP